MPIVDTFTLLWHHTHSGAHPGLSHIRRGGEVEGMREGRYPLDSWWHTLLDYGHVVDPLRAHIWTHSGVPLLLHHLSLLLTIPCPHQD